MTFVDVSRVTRLARMRPRIAFAARMCLWVCWLSVQLRAHSARTLVQSGMLERRLPATLPPARDAVRITRRVCRLRLFRLPLFPKICLRESLALYGVLSRLQHPVQLHIGIRKDGAALSGHSWITCSDCSLAPVEDRSSFKVLYSSPLNAARR
jgi:hypothetical protein